jgi:fatty acid desaturase
MAQILLTLAGAIILLMGTAHLVLTLRDVWKPTSFTPTEDAVRLAMQGARLRFNRRINLWESWLGFHISHSIGVMMFGAALLFVAQAHFDAFLQSLAGQAAAVLIAVAYLVVAIRFWFWGPVLGISVALLGILGAVLL